jgi:hypothetical protein
VLGWPERCKLTHAFLWEYGYERLNGWPNFWANLASFSLDAEAGAVAASDDVGLPRRVVEQREFTEIIAAPVLLDLNFWGTGGRGQGGDSLAGAEDVHGVAAGA